MIRDCDTDIVILWDRPLLSCLTSQKWPIVFMFFCHLSDLFFLFFWLLTLRLLGQRSTLEL